MVFLLKILNNSKQKNTSQVDLLNKFWIKILEDVCVEILSNLSSKDANWKISKKLSMLKNSQNSKNLI